MGGERGVFCAVGSSVHAAFKHANGFLWSDQSTLELLAGFETKAAVPTGVNVKKGLVSELSES